MNDRKVNARLEKAAKTQGVITKNRADAAGERYMAVAKVVHEHNKKKYSQKQK